MRAETGRFISWITLSDCNRLIQVLLALFVQDPYKLSFAHPPGGSALPSQLKGICLIALMYVRENFLSMPPDRAVFSAYSAAKCETKGWQWAKATSGK